MAESTIESPSVGFETLAEAKAAGGAFTTENENSIDADSPSSSVTWKMRDSGAVVESGHEWTREGDSTSQSFPDCPSESESSTGFRSKQ